MGALRGSLLAGVFAVSATAATAQTSLRIGLNEDPDILDPTLSRTYVGRIVFAGICDKLLDITADLKIVPQLATEYKWSDDNKTLTLKIRQGVQFHDGEPLTAEAVKFSLDRHMTFQNSFRKSELSAVAAVSVADPETVKIELNSPSAPLLAQLTDRSGMILSPKAAQALGDKFGAKPVCAGPFKFSDRVAQDRIVIEKFADYWDKGKINIDKVTYLPIPDQTVRLANLRSGQLDFIERLAATDVASVKQDANLKFESIVSLGYQGITINLANGDKAKNPLGQDARVRQALELSIDRDALNDVVFNSEFLSGNQWVAPENPYYVETVPVPKRDIAKAKQLLKEAGKPNVSFTLMTPIGPQTERVAQVIQSMAQEAGFDIKLQVTEFASALKFSEDGNMEAFLLAWSGRTDPDGNIYSFVTCKGPFNDGKYCNETVDKELNLARVGDQKQRAEHYALAEKRLAQDLPIIYIYHAKWLYAFTKKLTGFKPYPDGLIRLHGMKLE